MRVFGFTPVDLVRYGGQPLLWDRGVRCLISVGGPSVAGVYFDETDFGLIAAICALWPWINDLGGALKDRLLNMAVSAVAILVGGALGFASSSSFWLQLGVLFLCSLAIGWVHNTSRGLENAARCLGFAFVIVASLHLSDPRIAAAALAGAFWSMIVVVADYFIRRPFVVETGSHARAGFHRLFTEHAADWRFGLRYGLAAALGLGLAQEIGSTHAGWATVTTLAVMRPNKSESVQLVLQRAFGTVVGVALALIVVTATHNPWLLAAWASILAFFISPGLIWQRWSGFAAITAMALVLLDMALLTQGGDRPLLLERLYDTGLGCAIALGATWLVFPKRASSATRS